MTVAPDEAGDVIPWPVLLPDAALEMRLPADPALIRVVRLATSGVAAMAGFDLDGIEDLKIAVDEICSTLIELTDGGPVELRMGRVEPSGVLLEGEAAVAPGAGTDDDRLELGDRILEVIVDRHELVVGDGRARFRVLRLAEPAVDGDGDAEQ